MRTEILFTENIEAAQVEIEQIDGRINQVFTDQLFVAKIPDEFEVRKLKYSEPVKRRNLSAASKLAYDAWEEFREKKNRRRTLEFGFDKRERMSWDAEGYEAPEWVNPGVVGLDAIGIETSLYMTGTVAVGIIIVSGQGDLKFSEQESRKVISEVQEGLSFLSNAEPRAKLRFFYDIQRLDVTAKQGNVGSREAAESPWRDEALGKMGYPAKRESAFEYVKALRTSKRTDWAYAGYFTKYSLYHFAYNVNERVVMNFSNGKWGSDFINGVFAHETCHVFGAADEHGTCYCNTKHGQLNIENGNCKRCATSPVDCLMDQNTLSLCKWTRGQIGWDEQLFP